MSPLILLIGFVFAGGVMASSGKPKPGKGRRNIPLKLSDKSKKLLAKAGGSVDAFGSAKTVQKTGILGGGSKFFAPNIGASPIVAMTDFPKPYDYASVLAVCDLLLKQYIVGGSPSQGDVLAADAQLRNNLKANKAAAETSSEPKWVRATQLVYSVLIPWLAGGLGWSKMAGSPKIPMEPGKVEANARKLSSYAFYVAMFFVGPATSLVPKNVSILTAYQNGSFVHEAAFWKKPTVDEQFEALADLHQVLRNMGAVWTRQQPVGGLGCDDADEDNVLCTWLPGQQAAGAARVEAIKGRYFGPIATPGHVVEGSVELAAEIARYSVETAGRLGAMRLSEMREAAPARIVGWLTAILLVVAAVLITVAAFYISAALAPVLAALGAAIAGVPVVGAVYTFIAGVIASIEGIIVSVLGEATVGLIFTIVTLAAQAVVASAVVGLMAEAGLDDIIDELGWREFFENFGLEANAKFEQAAVTAQAGLQAGLQAGKDAGYGYAKTFL